MVGHNQQLQLLTAWPLDLILTFALALIIEAVPKRSQFIDFTLVHIPAINGHNIIYLFHSCVDADIVNQFV